MTGEERRYKIQQIKHYEEQISKKEKETSLNTFLFGLAAAASLFAFSTAHGNSANSTIELQILNILLGLANTGFGAYHLKNLIETISKKVNLQNKVESIYDELEMSKDDFDLGMKL